MRKNLWNKSKNDAKLVKNSFNNYLQLPMQEPHFKFSGRPKAKPKPFMNFKLTKKNFMKEFENQINFHKEIN